MTLVLLMTVATGAWADIAQGDVFMFGSYIDFGTSVKCKLSSGGTDDYTVAKSTKLPLTYGGYENGKHQLVFKSADATSYLYIVDTNSAKPWGIKVTGGDGSSDNPFTFSTVYDWPNNCPQELIIGTDGTCSFDMPASDATVDYDIVRDMEDETYPVEFSGLAERVIVKKKTDSEAYEPLTALNIQLIDDISGSDVDIFSADGITINVLKGTKNDGTGTITYDDPVAYATFTANMQPGYYKIVAEPTDPATSPYTGTASQEFETLAGYPVDVPGKEYVTYYSATDNLTLEENSGAQLYTITAVSGSTATATEITSANKETPFLVYNSADDKKTIILIPTADVIDGQTHASEFVGTAEATTIEASDATVDNYAFNGKQFVWVTEDLAVAANKAWLSISATSGARVINLVFDDATRIDGVARTAEQSGDYYDLNGRKLAAKPTRKGVYIQNGKKVVVK